jgi:XRE family aerobic/anaerobic benzoate catabolism transcriptional regulator
LKALPEEHMERVRKQGDDRPMAGNPKAMDELRSLLTDREDLYGQADGLVDTSNKSPQDSLQDLIEKTTQIMGD